jgi:hypothetical protein
MDDDLIECCDELCDDKPVSWWKILLFLWMLS